MSGWDASSRPSWDPQGGAGENTQAFGTPEPAEGTDDRWPEPGAMPAGSGYTPEHSRRPDGTQPSRRPARHRPEEPAADEGGFPSSASPGAPPPIFLQDYDQNDYAQGDFGLGDSAQGGFGGQGEFGQNGFGQRDFGQRDSGQRPPADYAPQDFPGQDYAPQDYSRERAPRDDARRGYPFTDHPDPHGQAAQQAQAQAQDQAYAARMDPALRDFFAPPPPRQDRPQRPDRLEGPDRLDRPDWQDRQDRAQGYGQRGASGYGGQARSWDATSPRPGSRSARRQEQEEESGHHGLIIAIVVIVILAAAGGGYYLLTRHHAGSNTQAPPASTPTTSASATQSAAAGPPARTAGYTLTVPVTAGGYHALTSIPTAMQSTAGTTETAIAGTALRNGGGKVAGRGVATAYQLSGGQTMTYMGYQGTFNPDKVITNLAGLGSSMQTYNPGPHGGKFACATAPHAPGASSGTVCMWVTTTTFAVTEFFGSTGPEVVSHQSKAAADTLNVRNSVEVPKA